MTILIMSSTIVLVISIWFSLCFFAFFRYPSFGIEADFYVQGGLKNQVSITSDEYV